MRELSLKAKPHSKYKFWNQEFESCVYPEFVRFFGNVRYLVKLKYRSFAAFSVALFEATGRRLTLNTVSGYEFGYMKTIQYNYLRAIASFLGADVHEMMQVDFRERDERSSLPGSG